MLISLPSFAHRVPPACFLMACYCHIPYFFRALEIIQRYEFCGLASHWSILLHISEAAGNMYSFLEASLHAKNNQPELDLRWGGPLQMTFLKDTLKDFVIKEFPTDFLYTGKSLNISLMKEFP